MQRTTFVKKAQVELHVMTTCGFSLLASNLMLFPCRSGVQSVPVMNVIGTGKNFLFERDDREPTLYLLHKLNVHFCDQALSMPTNNPDFVLKNVFNVKDKVRRVSPRGGFMYLPSERLSRSLSSPVGVLVWV